MLASGSQLGRARTWAGAGPFVNRSTGTGQAAPETVADAVAKRSSVAGLLPGASHTWTNRCCSPAAGIVSSATGRTSVRANFRKYPSEPARRR